MTVSILAIGDLTVDIILGPLSDLPAWGEEGEVASLEARLGGNLGNFAVAARLLGLNVLCAGPIGDDDYGTRVLRDLEAIGCITKLVRSVAGVMPLRTRYSSAMLVRSGSLPCGTAFDLMMMCEGG